tara:strand:- start:931 stop:1632 length:702 start_codon:yes stop_codon:yes gene_type:complete
MNRPQTSRPHQSPEVRAGFTLIELLATMAVIAILSAAALPGIQSAIQTARQTQAAQHARGIGIALNSWAQDFEGIFPNREILESEGVSISSSNDVFRHLIPDLIDNERVFAVSASAWGQRADGRFSEGQALEPGENHFAYISGLLTTSRSFWPLIVDGTDGSGFYHSKVGEKGGAWAGRQAIVVRVDGSVTKERMKRDGEKRFIPRLDEDTENALEIDSYMPDGVELLDPAGE